jgi:hypothetical protein
MAKGDLIYNYRIGVRVCSGGILLPLVRFHAVRRLEWYYNKFCIDRCESHLIIW